MIHSTTEVVDKVNRTIRRDTVVTQGARIFQYFCTTHEALLIRWIFSFLEELFLHILNGIVGLDRDCSGFAGHSFHGQGKTVNLTFTEFDSNSTKVAFVPTKWKAFVFF